MPVSKKRKKDGKPVHRARPQATPEAPAEGEQAATSEVHASHPLGRTGRPSNPFVTQQQGRRGSQRGR